MSSTENPRLHISAFKADQVQTLARAPIRMFRYAFSVGLSFFGVFCLLTGYLLFRSKFFPAILGLLMAAGGAAYVVNSFVVFLALPEIPHILPVPLIGEGSLFLWLVVIGLNEEKWHAQAAASTS